MDFHSHLHQSEIIGLLGGTIDAEESELLISHSYACSSSHSTGTQVDVDPISEMEAGEYFESRGVRLVGWYHSHPNFEPNPSIRDIETQTMYQTLCKEAHHSLGNEPFVGLIINPYLAVTENHSHVECFNVSYGPEIKAETLPYRFKLQVISNIDDDERVKEMLSSMKQLYEYSLESKDRIDLLKGSATSGTQRKLEKLLESLKQHGGLQEEHLELLDQIKAIVTLEANGKV